MSCFMGKMVGLLFQIASSSRCVKFARYVRGGHERNGKKYCSCNLVKERSLSVMKLFVRIGHEIFHVLLPFFVLSLCAD